MILRGNEFKFWTMHDSFVLITIQDSDDIG